MGFVLAALSPVLNRWFGQRTSLLALFPAALTVWLLLQAPEVLENGRLLFGGGGCLLLESVFLFCWTDYRCSLGY